MSGVIDEDGTQWEHCAVCSKFVRIQDLLYEEPSERFKYGRDIGPCCIDLSAGQQDEIAGRARRRNIVEHMLRDTYNGKNPILHKRGGISWGPSPQDEDAPRWVSTDHGNGVTSATVHPDDIEKSRRETNRWLDGYQRAHSEVQAMDQDEIDQRYEQYLINAV